LNSGWHAVNNVMVAETAFIVAGCDAAQTIGTKLKHSKEQLYGSALFLIDHDKVV
jgi:hypothetical protein